MKMSQQKLQKIRLKIPYEPHSGQQVFHDSQAKHRIWIGGRQGGKTKAGANEAVKLAVKLGSNTVGFVVAPTYWHTQKCWREILKIVRPLVTKVIGVDVNLALDKVMRADRCLILRGNRHIWFKSADNPDSLRSERLDWAWLDECALIKEEGWNAIEPALMGPVIMTSTPKGHNWVFELWTRGQDHLQSDFESWNFPTSINPYYPKDKIEWARQLLPDMVFRQEYLAEFIEDIGAVFRNVRAYIKELPLKATPNHRYVVGADLAKHEDFTVLTAMDVDSGELHGFERFSQLDWVFQCRRIVNFCQQYNNARLLIDSTGVGDPIYDELRRQQLRVDGYKFTSATKADLIENLSLMLDNAQLSYPDIPELINELRLFGYETGSTGTIRYRAPEGYHDDCVISLALAAWQIKTRRIYGARFVNW